MFDTKKKTTFEALKDTLGLSNSMQSPKIQKVVVSVGIGSTSDKNKITLIEDRIIKITGQKPVINKAKKAVASFKTRIGDPVGYQVTLRGARMEDFLNKLIHIALPRTKDFRGLPVSAIDEMGNYTIGITEHTIFPETSDEDVRDVFGMAVTIVTSAQDKKTAEALLRHVGIPFAKS